MYAGNPHYVPVYEDYARDSPYPQLISGENYDWLTNRPWLAQQNIEQIARPIHNVFTALRPAAQLAVALGQVGHTYYLTAEQFQREQALREQMAARARVPPLIERPKRSEVTTRRTHARSLERPPEFEELESWAHQRHWKDRIKRASKTSTPGIIPPADPTGIEVIDTPIVPPTAEPPVDVPIDKAAKRKIDLAANALIRKAMNESKAAIKSPKNSPAANLSKKKRK